MHDLLWGSIIGLIFVVIFVIAEIMRKYGCDVEVTRKFAHFGGAFFTIFFPFLFSSHWTVLILAIGFALLMFGTKKLGLLQSVHGVSRKSEGALYHPIAIYLCFLYSQALNQPWFYVIAILVLGISDASAALVGKNYGTNEYVVEVGSKKSFEGSFTFFLTSFLIIHLILLLATNTGRLESVLIALLISVIVTVFEAVSLKGADNLFIPLATMFVLSKNLAPTIEGISFQLGILIAFLIGYLIVLYPYKKIGFSGVVFVGLINYIIFALLGNAYAIILAGFVLICAKTSLILNYDCEDSDSYRVRPVFYILAIPIVCAFLGDYLNQFTCGCWANFVIYPFITSIICEGAIIRTRFFQGNLNKGLWATSIISIVVTALAIGVNYVFIK